jgi:putative ABC transport system permease protein
MKSVDLIWQAFGNLWARRWRTAFNLVGVILGCLVLAMAIAGARGVARGVRLMLDSDDEIKQIFLYPHYQQPVDVPDEARQVQGDMDQDRREALKKRLESEWKNAHASTRIIDQQTIDQIRQMDHVVEVVPRQVVRVEIELEGRTQWSLCEGISAQDQAIAKRLVVGHMPAEEAHDQVLIGEFAAYQLGLHERSKVEQLLGKELKIRFTNSSGSYSPLQILLAQANLPSTTADLDKFQGAIQGLIEYLDHTSLAPEQAKILKKALDSFAQEHRPGTVEHVYRVAGVVELPKNQYVSPFKGFIPVAQGDVHVHHLVLSEVMTSINPNANKGQGLAVRIDELSNLSAIDKSLRDLGFYTASVAGLLDHMEREIKQAKWIVALIGLGALAMAAFFMSNTMAISAMERIPEFGVMKALGAKDRQVMGLMLCEGALVGWIGAAVASLLSLGTAKIVERFVQSYVSMRLREEYRGEIFHFLWGEFALIFATAVVFCTLASVLPALRAARLNPIDAMRRS